MSASRILSAPEISGTASERKSVGRVEAGNPQRSGFLCCGHLDLLLMRWWDVERGPTKTRDSARAEANSDGLGYQPRLAQRLYALRRARRLDRPCPILMSLAGFGWPAWAGRPRRSSERSGG